MAMRCHTPENNISCDKCSFSTKIISKLFLHYAKDHADEGGF